MSKKHQFHYTKRERDAEREIDALLHRFGANPKTSILDQLKLGKIN